MIRVNKTEKSEASDCCLETKAASCRATAHFSAPLLELMLLFPAFWVILY